MKNKIKVYLITVLLFFNYNMDAQDKKNTFITSDNFDAGFGKELVSAYNIYTTMKRSGLKDFAFAVFDFDFETNKESNIKDLAKYLKDHYPYTDIKVSKEKKLWTLSANTNEIPVSEDILTYWALDMYRIGYEYDCRLTGYGALMDYKKQNLPNLDSSKEKEYIDKASKCSKSEDLSGAIINYSLAIKINPKNAEAFYKRARHVEDLHTWKDALSDYDKAIELDPNFTSAIVNRGALRDDNEDHKGAIEDYNKVISINKKDDKDNLTMAYRNRGNSKYNLKDTKGACADWKKAYQLGDKDVMETINEYCK
jgi:tetratricopeptide (TPR) repeat protein